MDEQKPPSSDNDFQTLSVFLVLGVLSILFVLGMKWVLFAPSNQVALPAVIEANRP